jgi:hypothetical protein
MIVPTVGRVVWFHPSRSEGVTAPLAGLVAYVHSPTMINIAYFDVNGVAHSATSVPLHQDGDERPSGFYAEWMPYQKGQAAKTEALEKQVAGA